jgi:starch synthase (maltosyl-transferring)
MIERLNRIRRENAALHDLTNVTFLDTANDALIAYAKHAQGNTIISVVSIDPHQAQEGLAIVPANLGLPPSFTAHDLLTGDRFLWRIGQNYIRLEPGVRQAHVVRVEM